MPVVANERRLRLTTEQTLRPATATGYASIEDAPGELHLHRNDLGGDPSALTSTSATVLLRLLHLTDLHVMDAASPARCDWVEARVAERKWWPLLHMARSFDTLTNWGAAAMASAVQGNGAEFADLAIATGDNIDNAQRNELDAFLSLLDGGTFSLPYDGPQRSAWAEDTRADYLRADGLWPFWLPDGGPDDMWRTTHGFPVLPGLLDATGELCTSPGLGLPWLGALGNHDVMRQGTVYSPPALEAIAIGGWRAISPGPAFDPVDPFAAYMADPTAFSEGAHRRTVKAEPDRRSITSAEFIRAHIDRGRGFTTEASGDYLHDTEHVRLVVLDTNHPTGHYQGSVGQSQLAWLDQQIADAASRPVVVISHHGQVAMDNTYGNGPDTDRRLGDAMAEVLHRHHNVVAWLVGHRHVHRIRPVSDPAGQGSGYWEITTSSIIDWPNQARVVEIIRGTDGSVGVRTTVVDHDATDTSPDTPWQPRLGALHRELAYNSGRVFSTRSTEGHPGDRNTVLARPLR